MSGTINGLYLPMDHGRRRLRGRHDDHLGDIHVFRPACTPDNRLGDILPGQWFQALVGLGCAFTISTKSDQTKLGFGQTWIH